MRIAILDVKAFRSVVISVSDLDRSLAFYRDLLGFTVIERGAALAVLDVGSDHTLRLACATAPARPSAWIPDDLQTGVRHLGFKARNVDATTARLKAAGVSFTLEPLDATGGVRIAFFKDPDGALLEIVQKELHYHVDGPAVGGLPFIVPPGETLLFDHAAVTVSNLDAALAYYEHQFSLPVIGQLIFNDARGFTITYLKAGTAVLELFSFSAPTLPNYYDPDPAVLGLKQIVLEIAGVNAPDGTPIELVAGE